jgi:hypothetical protein
MAQKDLGAANYLRPAGFTFKDAQSFEQFDPGAAVNVHRVAGRVLAFVGIQFGSVPSAQQAHDALLSSGSASVVGYVEVWESDNTFLGTGYNDYVYISVYA